jgi:hypothetical protein
VAGGLSVEAGHVILGLLSASGVVLIFSSLASLP